MLLVFSVLISFLFAFINGFHDGCNVFATAVASRSIKPKNALLLACISECIIPIVSGTAVASTVAKGILSEDKLIKNNYDIRHSLMVILSALIGSILWNLITWKFGLPSSSSHALIGGMIGAGIFAFGLNSIKWSILLNKVIVVLLVTPIIGFVVGLMIMRFSIFCLKSLSNKFNNVVKKLHYPSIILLAGSHGIADAQKTMGIVTLLLVISGELDGFTVPFWIRICSSSCLAIGMLFGGWRILHTIGNKIYKLKPLNSLDAQIAAASVIYISSIIGGTVSTSQIVSSTIVGVGAGERYNAVNWKSVENILSSWLLTIPASAVVSMMVFLVGKLLLQL